MDSKMAAFWPDLPVGNIADHRSHLPVGDGINRAALHAEVAKPAVFYIRNDGVQVLSIPVFSSP